MSAADEHYQGNIPVADAYIGDMLGNQSRRAQSMDFITDLLRVSATQNQGRMTQADAFAFNQAKNDKTT